MSLITRCPACGTMFKVVADQLKIAQGWARCGHCAEVFDASAQLQTAEPAPPLEAPSAPPAPVVQAPVEPPVPDSVPDPAPSPIIPSEDAASASTAQAPASITPAEDPADFDPAGWKQALLQREQLLIAPPLVSKSAPDEPPASAEPPQTLKPARETDEPGVFAADDADLAGSHDEVLAEQQVSFVLEARRKEFWKKPLVRVLLTVLLLALSSLLLLQWTVQHKDQLAAREPRLVPALKLLCAGLQCQIRPPRQIESLVIDSSTFNKTGSDSYRLSFTLKNSGDMALEVPSLELTLTDTQDHAIVRRVLLPAQFGVTAATLAAGSELAGVVSLKVSGDAALAGSSAPPAASSLPLRVAGYRILAFYP